MPMINQPPSGDLSEEVAFWRDFIEWWGRERERPVPPRAWEALAYAEAKRNDFRWRLSCRCIEQV